MSNQDVTRLTEVRPAPPPDFIGKEGTRGQQLAPNTPMPVPVASAAPEVPSPSAPPAAQE